MEPLQPTAHTRRRVSLLGQEFLAGFLRAESERHPGNVAALAELGHALTRLGRFQEGLEIDLKLVRLDPLNPVVHYNLACSLALQARVDEALDALERSAALGYDDGAFLERDEDLAALRDEPRFRELVRRLQAAGAEQR